MNYRELLVYLDIDNPGEFKFFEMMADLLECEEDIELEAIYQLFMDSDKEEVSQLLNEYFEEITNALPDDSDSVFSLLDQIRLFLMGLIENAEDDSDYRRFADEFNRFRTWYSFDSQVEILSDDEQAGLEEIQCLRDAITTARIDKLNGESHRFNYDNALDYELDSYTMSFANLMAAEDDSE